MDRKVICIESRGVLDISDDSTPINQLSDVRAGADQFLLALHIMNYRIIVLSSSIDKMIMHNWLRDNNCLEYVDMIVNAKPYADIYIDDRSICFQGDFIQTLSEVENFKPTSQKLQAL